jgi:alkylated DNA repair dioxygenase AlkB
MPERIEVQNGWYLLLEDFLKKAESIHLFQHLLSNLPWTQHHVTIFGKRFPTPRLESFHAFNEQRYSYSGNELKTNPFTPELQEILSKIQGIHHHDFNVVLANLYRDGNDSNGWHADNEKELGRNPTIASLSLGAARRFDLKHNDSKEKISLDLKSGTLLIMGGEMQHFWKHTIAKTKKVQDPRINLTFRRIT